MNPTKLTDLQFWQICEPIIQKALGEINATVGKSTPTSHALHALMNRIVGSVHSLMVLAERGKGNHALDECAILRACYDAFIQAAYIAHDPATAAELASDYLDFYHIERLKSANRLNASGATGLQSRINNSPLRANAEPKLNSEFNRVQHRFIKSRPGKNVKYRDNWYKGTLSDLADMTGWGDEYKVILASLHSSVHSGIYAISNNGSVPVEHIPFMAQSLVFRILKRIGSVHALTFRDPDVIDLIASADDSIIE